MTTFGTHRGNTFTDAAFEYVAQAPALESVTMGYARTMGDAATAHLVRAPALRHLHLAGWRMGDRSCELLANAPALTQLRLSTRRLSNAGLAHLNQCQGLKQLKVDDCPFVTEDGIGHLRHDIDVDYSPATPRQMIETLLDDELARDRAVSALARQGEAARDDLMTFARIAPESLRPTFQDLLSRLNHGLD
ncbi:MAG: hypothetical protein HN712_03095 [Gemmatimonadetes bacterium]|jgi:hypothetical protein|nr:hypothetical protein [Gemmatimonadota bacterium]MBT7859265.1 hypothetical protein [Gemmatimonadota bacterium]